MKKEPMKLSASDKSKIYELMSNFQTKLDMLAKDDFQYEAQPLNQSQPVNYSIVSPKKSQLHPEDLVNSRQSIPSSPVLSKISQMQEHYLSKLTVLNQKVTFLESQNSQLKELARSLQNQIAESKERLELQERNQESIVDSRIEELKENLMSRLREEVELQVQGYIEELKKMREEVTKQRKDKKQLQKQMQMLMFQRDNFEELYKQMMSKYKMLMKADIESYQLNKQQTKDISLNVPQSNSYIEPRNRNESKNSDNLGVTKKKKSSKKVKSEKEPQTMPKEQLIPFLTKGIEELKQKLKLK